MGLAVISANTTLKVSAKVGATRQTTGTLYTAPANGYADVLLAVKYVAGAGSTIDFSVDGFSIATANVTSTVALFQGQPTASQQITNGTTSLTCIRLAFGQVLTATFSVASAASASVVGVEIINSP